MTKKLVLLDGLALVHRAFHALPPTLNSPQGIPTNAVYGVTSVLMKIIKDLRPDYIAAAFDAPGPTFRHKEFEHYKGTRVKAADELYVQIPLVQQMIRAFGIPVFEQPGYEADDIIGSLVHKVKKHKKLQTVIATGDLDTLQLVDGKRVVVFTLRKGIADTVTYDGSAVRERYGLSPEQMLDYKGLRGDPSDNIPGVPGIGDKTAATLIQRFTSMENL
ncbi:MAG: 5'-3' exonuclease H3TH domain-containing protein, partial [Patescibacteria group bacterium]